MQNSGVIPTEKDLFKGNTVTQDGLDAFFNQVIETFRASEKNVDYDKIRLSIADSMNEMCDLSGDYNVKVGRKELITNKKYTERSGYRTRNLELSKIYH